MESGVIFVGNTGGNSKRNDPHQRLNEKIHELEENVDKLKEKLNENGQSGKKDEDQAKSKQDDPIEKAHDDSAKDSIKEIDKNVKKIDNLVEGSDKVLIKVKSSIPSFLYLDDISVDINKTTVNNKRFLSPAVPITFVNTEIKSVVVVNAFVFASLEIDDGQQKAQLKFLAPENAYEVKKIIDGIVVAKKQSIDLPSIATLEKEELKEKFEKIGE